VKQRLEYLEQIMHKAYIARNLSDLFHHNELSIGIYAKQFREINMHALDGSRNFIAS